MKKTLIITGEIARKAACREVLASPEGWVVSFSAPKRKTIQSDKFHAMIFDISKQCQFMGKKLDAEDWKRLLIDAFSKAMRDAGTPLHHDGRVVPSLDGERVVQLGIQSRDFYVKEAAEFTEFLYAWGSEQSVRWSEPGYNGE